MSEASFVVRVSSKLANGALRPFTLFGKGLDAISTGSRKTMRSFRDLVIVAYGVRRGFDLLSRTISKTFASAGGEGSKQINLLSNAVSLFGADVGKTIQKSKAFQVVMEKLISSFAAGISEGTQDKIAKGFDNVVVGILKTLKTAMKGVESLFAGIQDAWNRLSYNWGPGVKAGALTTGGGGGGGYSGIANLWGMLGQGGSSGSGLNESSNPGNMDSAARAMGMGPSQNVPYPPQYGGPALFDNLVAQLRAAKKPGSGAAAASGPPSMFSDAYSVIDDLIAKVGGNSKEKPLDLDLLQKFQINAQAAINTVDELGGAWHTVMSNFAEEAFDSSVGVEKAFKNLGKNARKSFVSQMSSAAFSPLTQSFNLLANALAMPFKIVGQFINDLFIDPVVTFIATTLKSLFSSIVGTAIATKAAGSGLQAASLAENLVTSQALLSMYAPAAVAAAIGSFGGANAAGAIAMGQIQAARIPLAAEGMVVMPRSGGTLVGVGEGGEPETILPLSKAKEMGFGGGGGLTIIVNGDLKSTSSNRRLARNLAKEVHREMTAGRYAGGSRRRV